MDMSAVESWDVEQIADVVLIRSGQAHMCSLITQSSSSSKQQTDCCCYADKLQSGQTPMCVKLDCP